MTYREVICLRILQMDLPKRCGKLFGIKIKAQRVTRTETGHITPREIYLHALTRMYKILLVMIKSSEYRKDSL